MFYRLVENLNCKCYALPVEFTTFKSHNLYEAGNANIKMIRLGYKSHTIVKKSVWGRNIVLFQ